MKCENYKCYSETKKGLVDPMLHFKARFGRVDAVISSLKKLRPSELNLYVSKLIANFTEVVDNYIIDYKIFNWDSIREGLELVPNFPELEKVVFLYICKTLKLPLDYTPEKGEVELLFFDRVKAGETVSFYLVKTFADVYGRDEGIEIYKQIVPFVLRKRKEEYPEEVPEDPKTKTILENVNNSIESWCNIGLVDFSHCILDDFRVIYRFDKCLVPSVLKDFNDPDLAYLASCYMGDHPEMNKNKVIHMRRTQTLHHAEFCDEFYWNNLVQPDAEQPSLEFTKNIGKNLERL